MLFRSSKMGATYPEDMDIYTFLFEDFPTNRADPRNRSQPMLIDEETGKGLTFEQVKEAVDLLGLGMANELGLAWDSIVAIYSSNSLYYPIAVWAAYRQGAVVSCANPAFSPSELAYQLDTSKAEVLITGYSNRQAAYDAAEKQGLKRDRVVVLLDTVLVSKLGQPAKVDGAWTIEGLIASGQQQVSSSGLPVRQKLSAGSARKKLALLSFSSGTTGLPKGVAISHASPIANILQILSFNDIGADWKPEKGRFRPGRDISLGHLPLFHIYGLSTLFFQFWIGCATVIVPRFRGIEPMLKSCIRYEISSRWLVPPMVVLLCKDPSARKYHTEIRKIVNFVMISAAPLSDDLSRSLEEVLPGVDWGQGFGMTELSTLALMHPRNMKPVLGSAGQLASDTEAKVVRPDGSECGLGEPGELLIRGPQTALGYLNNEKATKEMFIEDGWVRTGDGVVFRRNAENPDTFDAFVVERIKELIKVNANQVAPAELEGSILQLFDVKDAGVIGIPDEMTGERPIAFVTLSADAIKRVEQKGDEEVLRIKEGIKKHIRDTKVSYKRLQRVEIIDAIPATPSGKILRRELRDLAKKLAPLPSSSRL